MTVDWPELIPSRLPGGMAATIERTKTAKGDYPLEWPAAAYLIKVMAGWRCERCGVAHGPVPNVLTVHHLDGVKTNLWGWNLAALCQRCHLRIQAKVLWDRLWPWPHSPWMARHIEDFNAYARPRGIPTMPLVGVENRDYSQEWTA